MISNLTQIDEMRDRALRLLRRWIADDAAHLSADDREILWEETKIFIDDNES